MPAKKKGNKKAKKQNIEKKGKPESFGGLKKLNSTLFFNSSLEELEVYACSSLTTSYTGYCCC